MPSVPRKPNYPTHVTRGRSNSSLFLPAQFHISSSTKTPLQPSFTLRSKEPEPLSSVDRVLVVKARISSAYLSNPIMGSVVIPHLITGWHVDQAILSEDARLVVIRFGRDHDPDCMRQDEVLYKIADRVKNFAVIYVCDLDQVPDFKQMYELYDPVTLMFFFRNKHMMCDFGTGNNNKLNWVLEDKQELIDIIETIYKGAKKGRGLVVSPKDYSTRYRY